MYVSEVMVGPAVCCNAKTNLGEAAEIMWKQNCGLLPITNIQNRVIGVVTDRDLFIALATRNRLPGDLTVGDVTSRRLYSCKLNDEIHTALATMSEHGVRRLPVLNDFGKVVGILSVDDLIISAQMGDKPALSSEDVVRTLRRICAPHYPQVQHKKLATAA